MKDASEKKFPTKKSVNSREMEENANPAAHKMIEVSTKSQRELGAHIPPPINILERRFNSHTTEFRNTRPVKTQWINSFEMRSKQLNHRKGDPLLHDFVHVVG